MPAREFSESAAGDERTRSRSIPRSGMRRSRKLLASIPVVLVSVVAMTFNLSSPAEAATALKKPAKAKSTTPGPTTTAAVASSTPAEPAPSEYLVVEGDTISGIAGRYGLSTASVLALNGLGWSATIFPGQKLTLNSSNSAVTAVKPAQSLASEIARYTIRSGDTISGVAAAHGLSTDAVLSANGLSTSSVIFPGQTIVLPANGAGASSHAAPTPVASVEPVSTHTATYTIVSGDTISGVAAGLGVSVQSVLDANGLSPESMIYPGQMLAIPAADTVAVSAAVSVTPLAPLPQVDAPPAPVVFAPGVVPLTDEMRRNADTIITVGRSAGISDFGIVIALAAAAQESGLRNITHGDRDSLGLFQQRPSFGWGTAEQVLDPTRATLAFFGGSVNPNDRTRGLLDVSGWEMMTVTQAAQAVQISGYPDHYAKWETSARAWLAQLG